jgi:type III secretion protein L
MLQLKDLSTLKLEPGRKIVRAEELQVCLEAQGIIEAAREEAKRIVDEAQAEFERQSAAGFEEGVAAGRMEIAERMIESVNKTVHYVSGLEKSVVEIVMKALRRILGDMPERERVTQVVKSALAVARTQRSVVVRVHPADAEHVRARVDEITKPYPNVSFLEVTPDPRLQPGGCILESEIGVIDASLEAQLQAIENSLSRTFLSPAQES